MGEFFALHIGKRWNGLDFFVLWSHLALPVPRPTIRVPNGVASVAVSRNVALIPTCSGRQQ